jgi:DNA-binding NtrC family response regulator
MRLPRSRLYSLLIVEPDDAWSLRLRDIGTRLVRVKVCRDFQSARRELSVDPFPFIVTNIRLGAYNGIQLVYMVREAFPPCRAIAYTEAWDVWLGREAQRAGAFYDTRDCLPMTLPGLLTTQLPASDRREPAQRDRRLPPRVGGRRASDRQRQAHESPRSPR